MADDDIHAALRGLVDEGGPAASDDALRDVIHRGRRKRMHMRVGAVAGVVAVVVGIGTAMVTVPELGAAPLQRAPVAAPGWGKRAPEQTTGQEKPPDPAPSRMRAPDAPAGGSTWNPPPPASCQTGSNSGDQPITDLPVPSGVRVCPGSDDEVYHHVFDLVSAALSGTGVTVKPDKGGAVATVSGPGYVSSVSVITRRYSGDPARGGEPMGDGGPMMYRTPRKDIRADLQQSRPDPAVMLYFSDGRLYVVRVHPPDLPPERVMGKIIGKLSEWGKK